MFAVFIGFYSHQAWSISACSTVAEAAGSSYQLAENSMGMRINQSPPPALQAIKMERIGVWHIYQTQQPLFSEICSAIIPTVDDASPRQPSPGLVYPVLKNRFNQGYAVINGRLLIKANDAAKLDRWQQEFELTRILTLYDGQTAIFQAKLQQDWGELINRLERQPGLISVTPLLSEKRYFTR